jgi:hypothetical protein
MIDSPQFVEWIREAKGEVRGRAQSLLRLLEKKFPSGLPTSLAARIQASANGVEIAHWFDAAIDARSLDDFRRASGL